MKTCEMARSSAFRFAGLFLGLSACIGNVYAQYPDPNDDPFYSQPGNVASYTTGAVISSRSVATPKETGGVDHTWQLLYRSTDTDGNAVANVATVWAPSNQNNKSPPKILLYGAAEDSLNIDCAPSYGFVNGDNSNVNNAEKNIQAPLIIPYAMSKGYYVVVADAEGPKSAWLTGLTEGRAALDAVKAAISQENLNAGFVFPNVALYGYSGGAHTIAWAASLVSTYSYNFHVVGAAHGGTPVDLKAAYQLVDGTSQSSLGAAAIFGLGNGHQDFNNSLQFLLTDEGRSVSSTLFRRNACVPNLQNNGGVPTNLEELFSQNPTGFQYFQDTFTKEALVSTANPYPIPVPTFPRLIYHGNQDKTVPYQPEADYVSQQCNSGKGAKIWFSTFPFDHGPSGAYGFVGALQFVSNALDGQDMTPPSCGATTVSMPFPNSNTAINMIGQSGSNILCYLCACC